MNTHLLKRVEEVGMIVINPHTYEEIKDEDLLMELGSLESDLITLNEGMVDFYLSRDTLFNQFLMHLSEVTTQWNSSKYILMTMIQNELDERCLRFSTYDYL